MATAFKIAAPARKTLAQIIAEQDPDGSYRPYSCKPSLSEVRASEHDIAMKGMVEEMSAVYASRGHAA
jgi:hypothetical protein